VLSLTTAWKMLGLTGTAGDSALQFRSKIERRMYPYLPLEDMMLAGQKEAHEEAHSQCWALAQGLVHDRQPRPSDRLWRWSELYQGQPPFDRYAAILRENTCHRFDQFRGPVLGNAIGKLIDTPVSEPWPLVIHLEVVNILSGMAPHGIVYTQHVLTVIRSKARACYASRQ